MTARTCAMLLSLLFLTALVPSVLLASDGGDRVQFFQNITVGPDDRVGDVSASSAPSEWPAPAGMRSRFLAALSWTGAPAAMWYRSEAA